MTEEKLPGDRLTVIFRDVSPTYFANDCAAYRSVQIKLTEDQLRVLALRKTHQIGKETYYEEISQCFIEGGKT